MTRRPTCTALAVLAATLAGCARVEPPPPGPSPFRGARRIVLVRRVDDPKAQRPRDAIDALKQSLDERGYEARVVEIGRGEAPGLRDLDRLEDELAARLWSRAPAAGTVERLGPEAGALVAKLGADAVAGYHRLDAWAAPPAPPPTFGVPPSSTMAKPSAARPSGGLSLVGADGSVAWFPWGGAAAEDPRALLNAAEAIDALLAALSGNTADDR